MRQPSELLAGQAHWPSARNASIIKTRHNRLVNGWLSVEITLPKLNYIHRNPLRAGLVDDPAAYPYSSYRNHDNGDQSLIEVDKDWS